ncbi:MAG: J domain-containing protein [Deltaproteobacteria bacterium]|nr:J domain-containing protein [Deltaproteobacteria bacterium]
MTKKEWQKILEAKQLLGLGDSATLAEIKHVFRSCSRQYHPDLAGNTRENRKKMQQINEAYQAILIYCTNFSFPLVFNEQDLEMDDEEWWMSRFGQDPHWSKK